ncbi:hypothetical protein V8F06_004039 [Rhypophila decipiens]
MFVLWLVVWVSQKKIGGMKRSLGWRIQHIRGFERRCFWWNFFCGLLVAGCIRLSLWFLGVYRAHGIGVSSLFCWQGCKVWCLGCRSLGRRYGW